MKGIDYQGHRYYIPINRTGRRPTSQGKTEMTYTAHVTDRNGETYNEEFTTEADAIRFAKEEAKWESCGHVEVKNDTGAVMFQVTGDFS